MFIVLYYRQWQIHMGGGQPSIQSKLDCTAAASYSMRPIRDVGLKTPNAPSGGVGGYQKIRGQNTHHPVQWRIQKF